MPAPDKDSIKAFLKASLITGADPLGPTVVGQRKAFLKVVNGATVPGTLPEAVDDLIDGLAEGISNQWAAWQITQTVTGTASGVTTGIMSAPVVGILP